MAEDDNSLRAWQTDVEAVPESGSDLALIFYKDGVLPMDGITVTLHQQTAFDLAIAILQHSQTDLVKAKLSAATQAAS
jgi:riboflavin synthase alpha subunit